MSRDPDTAIGGAAKAFPPTRRTMVDCLRSSEPAERERAADLLVEQYWKPLYKYLRLKWRRTNEEAKDLTQSFFAVALEKESFSSYDPAKGSFRTFVRILFDRFLANEEKARTRLKRGGTAEAVDFDEAERELGQISESHISDPDEYLRREWTREFFARSLEAFRADSDARGKTVQYQIFAAYDLADQPRPKYRELSQQFGIPESSVTNHLFAMRRRFREILLERLREATVSDEEFRQEARAMFGQEP